MAWWLVRKWDKNLAYKLGLKKDEMLVALTVLLMVLTRENLLVVHLVVLMVE